MYSGESRKETCETQVVHVTQEHRKSGNRISLESRENHENRMSFVFKENFSRLYKNMVEVPYWKIYEPYVQDLLET